MSQPSQVRICRGCGVIVGRAHGSALTNLPHRLPAGTCPAVALAEEEAGGTGLECSGRRGVDSRDKQAAILNVFKGTSPD